MISGRNPIGKLTRSLARPWPNMDWPPTTRQEQATTPRLILPDAIFHQVLRHLQHCLPMEGVGLLAVDGNAQNLVARRYYPGRNVDASPVRYTMHSWDVLAALQAMERRRTWLGAVVHSHPYTTPVPSETDRAEAALPGVLSVMVSLRQPVTAREWSFEFDLQGSARRSVEIPLVVASDHRAILPTTIVDSDSSRHRARLS